VILTIWRTCQHPKSQVLKYRESISGNIQQFAVAPATQIYLKHAREYHRLAVREIIAGDCSRPVSSPPLGRRTEPSGGTPLPVSVNQ
jgi:hypothetical protein